jgi:hypothetical protein
MKGGNNGKLFTDIHDCLFNFISGGMFMDIEYIFLLGFIAILFLAWLGISATNEIIEHKNQEFIFDKLMERKRNERI